MRLINWLKERLEPISQVQVFTYEDGHSKWECFYIGQWTGKRK